MITQRRSETAKVADEQAKGWCSKKPICIVGWMMRKRKMDIEHGTKDEHDKTRANNHRETQRERDTHTHKYMYVICIDMCCPCNVIYFVHSRARTHTHAYISDTIVHMQTCIAYHLWRNFPGNTSWIVFPLLLFEVKRSFCSDRLAVWCCQFPQFYPHFDSFKRWNCISPMDFEKWFCAEYFCTLNGVCALCCAQHVRAVQPDGPHDWYDAHGKRVLRIDLWIYELVTS